MLFKELIYLAGLALFGFLYERLEAFSPNTLVFAIGGTCYFILLRIIGELFDRFYQASMQSRPVTEGSPQSVVQINSLPLPLEDDAMRYKNSFSWTSFLGSMLVLSVSLAEYQLVTKGSVLPLYGKWRLIAEIIYGTNMLASVLVSVALFGSRGNLVGSFPLGVREPLSVVLIWAAAAMAVPYLTGGIGLMDLVDERWDIFMLSHIVFLSFCGFVAVNMCRQDSVMELSPGSVKRSVWAAAGFLAFAAWGNFWTQGTPFFRQTRILVYVCLFIASAVVCGVPLFAAFRLKLAGRVVHPDTKRWLAMCLMWVAVFALIASFEVFEHVLKLMGLT